MRRYEQVSGTIFVIVSLAQLTRILMGWPVQIDLFTVPIWFSGVAFLVMIVRFALSSTAGFVMLPLIMLLTS